MRVLGIFAHPDDEVFCGGGTLARCSEAGAETMVVSFTRGEQGQIHDAGLATRRTLGDRREQELRSSCGHLGVRHVRCLDYGDGRLQTLPQEILVRDVTAIIRAFRPDVVFTFDETGAYGHPDHIAVSVATTAACAQSADPAVFPEQLAEGLTPHAPLRLYHSYFPRNDRLLLRLLVEWLIQTDTKFRGSTGFIHALMLFADESSMLGYASDHIKTQWYPAGFYIIEQGEPATALYLIMSGEVDVIQEDEAGQRIYRERHGPGVFLGEAGLGYGKPRNAHCVAASNTTCLVFSPAEPTNFAGRGVDARYATQEQTARPGTTNRATTCIDVRAYIQVKMAAMAEHRTQYPITPDMFPPALVEELLGFEYFVQVLPAPELQTEFLPPQG